ncbi:MAG: hypothetical protein U0175_36375 [Caldilineaceae bacterium]
MNQRTKTLVTGAFAGAFIGVALAWIATDGDKDDEGNPVGLAALSTGDYFQLGMAILTLARQFSSMVKKT